MKTTLEKVTDCNLSYVKDYFPEKYENHKINEMNIGMENGEHYKLLSYLSDLFEDEIILDLGTRDGLSALVLSKNQKNKVITYDLLPKPIEMSKFEHLIPNCEFKQMNIFDISITFGLFESCLFTYYNELMMNNHYIIYREDYKVSLSKN
jgi:hypothetical protein